ncbi:MAG: alpha-galactosidase, partial [Prevotella sp.]
MMISKRLFLYAAFCMGVSLPAFPWQGRIEVTTPHTQMLLHANEGRDLRLDYFGSRLSNPWQITSTGTDLNASALPAFGTVDMLDTPALLLEHADGDQNLELTVTGVDTEKGSDYTLTTVTMKDKKQPVTVKVFYKAWQNVDIIETWTEINNGEKRAIRLKRFDSGHLTLRRGNVWLTHLHGNWAAETVPTSEALAPGMKVISNTDGARNAHCDAPEIMLSLDGQPNERQGRTIGLALCWSGNFEIRVNTPNNRLHEVFAGVDPQASDYVLDAGRSFTTPHLAMTYTDKGMGGVSRNFHYWARHDGMLHNGMATRDILLNSWEGIYFDITEDRIIKMMDDIKSMGGELFVMDDGWFGDKYPRKTDNSSLGDWVTDIRKLPHGLKALTDAAKERGIKFGIWLEPEATNTKSELYEKHPDWVLQTPGRQLKLGRGGTQLVLDMTNPKVQDFVFNIVDNLLTKNPEISYIKWDANASIQNVGSVYEPKNKQTNIYVDYHEGLLKVLQRIRAKYPNVVIQDCASGGGRANYGLLPYFDEFWVSDNNDPLQRVYIQWGTSYFFPSNAMAQHIGGSPYQMTGRITPIKFRCDVAMSGRLGMELQPSKMTEGERKQCTTAISDYKKLRPIVQLGNLYRLVSPYDHQGLASLMYVSDAKDKAVLFVYKTENFLNQPQPRIVLDGLDPDATYTLHE